MKTVSSLTNSLITQFYLTQTTRAANAMNTQRTRNNACNNAAYIDRVAQTCAQTRTNLSVAQARIDKLIR